MGSEGTLGVITEITLKLYPLPEAVSAAICHFPSIDAAVRTTIQTIQMGVPIARCELLDAHAIRAVNRHSRLGLAEQPLLLMEFHGSQSSVAEQAATVQDIAREHGGGHGVGGGRRHCLAPLFAVGITGRAVDHQAAAARLGFAAIPKD